MQRLTIIKLGGSLITEKSKSLTAREKVIARLAKEIKSASMEYRGKLIIGHGSGSFGHASAAKYKTQKGIINKASLKGASEVADVASRLTKIVVKHLRKAGLAVIAFAPASFIVSERQKAKRFFIEPIREALKRGLIPLVYGDVVFDKSQGFGIFSTEKVISVLVGSLSKDYKIERIIYCGDTNGVYDEDGKTIETITPDSFVELKKIVGASGATDVTGGMLHKVKESLQIAKKHQTEILIVNGRVSGIVRKATLGKKVLGTLIGLKNIRIDKN
ncbi:MAG: Aspartate/glutamate/uridylate kinase [Candidatus Woesebacteria bacterium GW2011_GWC2_47_16]|uniref:Isopentenyl phosphate kinase n=9 Tax=Candidatus Woeseibacteriota TaxID=1752722 RepID=A0A0G1TSY0_9BACT|nr:MAG: Aspartate/glutamate/uridylate kinase [Candidatus Woesebacteria bacterium GW2011_GWE1_45_18]KKU25044.1 MAG: Aspartate/glutamate/uridylate kinase [Candidatus Woesebacteria bacterium GW2011_GWF1_46_13]KKU48475.1 MAG: Aspartate/glutamate/uridylate kinase [Candidatus Woesebacteria bacterium GW2011_GWF2_46_8]KKU64686.1 MAG: Aspartate/glutamate/uridylate kinase [Candidatus Woesebacteria bacterium GW2011_GWC2_47_16]KKU70930.1 MAG: Aspartate/glutamate/uridylate kinase [Candidatus Woesebacteria b